MIEVLADSNPFERRAALFVDGALRKLAIDDPVQSGDEAEALYAVRLRTRERGLAGAFADLGNSVYGLLPEKAGGDGAEGTMVFAEIRRAAVGEKSAVLGRPRLKSRYWACDLTTGETVRREGSFEPEEPALAVDLEDLKRAAATVNADFAKAEGDGRCGRLRPAPSPLERVLRDAPGPLERIRVAGPEDAKAARQWVETQADAASIFVETEGASLFEETGLEEVLEGVRSAEIPLPSGGRLSLEPTRALCAVDVDTGAALGGGSRAALERKVNREAAEALAAAMALRGLGGLFAVDFAGRPRGRDARALEGAVRDAFGRWDLAPELAPLSRFGVLEGALPVRGPSLPERLETAEAQAARTLRRLWIEARAAPGTRWAVAAHPAVHGALEARAAETGPWAASRGVGAWSRSDRPEWPLARIEVTSAVSSR